MALQIKHDDGDENQEKELKNNFGNNPGEPEFNPEMEFDVFKIPEGVQRRAPEAPTGPASNVKMYDGSSTNVSVDKKLISGIITLILLVVGCIVLYKTVINPDKKDLTPYLRLSKDEICQQFGTEAKRDEGMDKFVPQYTNESVIEVYEGKRFYLIDIDKKFSGIHTDDKRWTVYGVYVGMGETKVDAALTYKYDSSFMVINELFGGHSSSDYYYNKANNDCLVITINDQSNRVVAITYYTDFKKVTENLSGID